MPLIAGCQSVTIVNIDRLPFWIAIVFEFALSMKVEFFNL